MNKKEIEKMENDYNNTLVIMVIIIFMLGIGVYVSNDAKLDAENKNKATLEQNDIRNFLNKNLIDLLENQTKFQTKLIDKLNINIQNYKDIIAYKDTMINYGTVLVLNPTYNEVVHFLKNDKTDEKEWTTDYDCTQFSYELLRNALNQSMYSCVVGIDFEQNTEGIKYGHNIIAFNTSDKGIVYFEPQSDNEVNLHIGMDYWYDQWTAVEQFNQMYWCNINDMYCPDNDIVIQYDSCFERVI